MSAGVGPTVGPVWVARRASGTCNGCCIELSDGDEVRLVGDLLLRQECCGCEYDEEVPS